MPLACHVHNGSDVDRRGQTMTDQTEAVTSPLKLPLIFSPGPCANPASDPRRLTPKISVISKVIQQPKRQLTRQQMNLNIIH